MRDRMSGAVAPEHAPPPVQPTRSGRAWRRQTGRAPDGAVVAVSGVGALSGDWFWSLRATSPRASVGLTVGAAGYLGLRAAEFPTPVEAVTYRGRELALRSGGTAAEPRWLAGLRGARHDLMCAGPGAPPRLADLVALLADLDPADAPGGLVLRTRGDTRLWGVCGRQYVAGVGTLTVYPRAEAAGLVPATPGKAVAHGRLWTTTAGFAPGTGGYFVHAGPTAVAMVRDERGIEADASDASVADLLESLRVDWAGAPS
ncbi:hypothetical protein GCM10010124_12250 [Pilimelia terevasa]|uniref:Uncharacterized protein n=1 Tax=Pilimelia terevasa TaxID=53372 RepID=A0A8J3BM99_9ACTN|nr:hypothetical protein [Pilimelia terevasa]GGK21302.1 hypothetical protein GCM10010124_12250 [Pilimelia terevasa]